MMRSIVRRVVRLAILGAILFGGYYYGGKYLWPPEDRSRINVVGVIEAPEVNVTSRIAGRIKQLDLVEGDQVKKGQTVALIEDIDIRNQLVKARAEFEERTDGGVGGSKWVAPLLPGDFVPPAPLARSLAGPRRPAPRAGFARAPQTLTHRSTSPMTTSVDPITAMTSAMRPPTIIFGRAWQAKNDGARAFTRTGRFVPSETT